MSISDVQQMLKRVKINPRLAHNNPFTLPEYCLKDSVMETRDQRSNVLLQGRLSNFNKRSRKSYPSENYGESERLRNILIALDRRDRLTDVSVPTLPLMEKAVRH